MRLWFIVLETAEALGDPRGAPESWISGKLWGPDACVHAKSLQSCLTLCDSTDCSPTGSSVCGFLQARIPERVAMPSSRGSSRPRDRNRVSCTAGRFFTNWATREVPESWYWWLNLQMIFSPRNLEGLFNPSAVFQAYFRLWFASPLCKSFRGSAFTVLSFDQAAQLHLFKRAPALDHICCPQMAPRTLHPSPLIG